MHTAQVADELFSLFFGKSVQTDPVHFLKMKAHAAFDLFAAFRDGYADGAAVAVVYPPRDQAAFFHVVEQPGNRRRFDIAVFGQILLHTPVAHAKKAQDFRLSRR